jgi:hypothetical protein
MNTEFRRVESPAFFARIWVSGDADSAKQITAQYLADIGLCVTITKTSFYYTGGQEEGMVIGLINYPRFPAGREEIKGKAIVLGEKIARYLGQGSYLVETPTETIWFTRRDGE